MKKTSLLILSLFFCLSIFAQKKENHIEIIYSKFYKNYKDKTSAQPKVLKGLEYQLLCNNTESEFKFLNTLQSGKQLENRKFIGKGGGLGLYYKNLKTRDKFQKFVSPHNMEEILIVDDFNKIKWQLLSNESKTILNYVCFKAIGTYTENFYDFKTKEDIVKSYEIIAWYTPNIPVSFGPSGYDGLPGMVLEAQRLSFGFSAVEVNFINKRLNVSKPTADKISSREDYISDLNNLMKERMNK